MTASSPLVIVRGGGDLGTGVAARLHRCGFAVVVLEIDRPLAVRRLVSLAEAIYADEVEIEDVRGRKVTTPAEVHEAHVAGLVPVMVDPTASSRTTLAPVAMVDARMRKLPPEIGKEAAPLAVGLGPGFRAGVDCHAVVETQRGHHMGRGSWTGAAQPDSRLPEPVTGFDADRVLRAPAEGKLQGMVALGDIVHRGQILARVDAVEVLAPFDGALRGLMHDGLPVWAGDKIGDLDPRKESANCREISDKSLAVGGGVLEAVLSQGEIRRRLGDSDAIPRGAPVQPRLERSIHGGRREVHGHGAPGGGVVCRGTRLDYVDDQAGIAPGRHGHPSHGPAAWLGSSYPLRTPTIEPIRPGHRTGRGKRAEVVGSQSGDGGCLAQTGGPSPGDPADRGGWCPRPFFESPRRTRARDPCIHRSGPECCRDGCSRPTGRLPIRVRAVEDVSLSI